MYCGYTVRPGAKVTIDSQPMGSRMCEIDWYRNERLSPLFRGHIKVMSTLRYIRRWISRKPLEIRAWFQRTTNMKLHMGYQTVTWSITSRDPRKVKLVTPIRLERKRLDRETPFQGPPVGNGLWGIMGYQMVTWPQRCCGAVRLLSYKP